MAYLNKRRSAKDLYLALANRPRKPNAFSQYRGVTKSATTDRPYRAVVQYQGKRYYLGDYADEKEAARVYNRHALRIIGDFALLNDV